MNNVYKIVINIMLIIIMMFFVTVLAYLLSFNKSSIFNYHKAITDLAYDVEYKNISPDGKYEIYFLENYLYCDDLQKNKDDSLYWKIYLEQINYETDLDVYWNEDNVVLRIDYTHKDQLGRDYLDKYDLTIPYSDFK